MCKVKDVNECGMVDIGGISQYISVKGKNKDNPIILLLHGGPGATLTTIENLLPSELEEKFLVAHWDQRGAGKSYSEDIPVESMNFEQFISDTLEVVDYLLDKYNREKIYLYGLSWGTVLGINATYRSPDKFYAYIATGQIVNTIEGDKIAYQAELSVAKEQNNNEALEKLKKIGEPPYMNDEDYIEFLKLLKELGVTEKNIDMFELYQENCSEEEFKELLHGLGFSNTFLLKELSSFNTKDINNIKVPVYFCMAREDYQTPSILVEQYYKDLVCPKKELTWFEESEHATILEEPKKFMEVLSKILEETYK